ncbi:HTH-type transcriptional repressor Bm3R1 [Peptococcaceae bacterium CEB3]|nr:HTH-type transcriptional repressor Bm3R1 [Peptococcaceae bacterium CEB3]
MNRRERKKEETRKNIISCAVRLFKEKSFQETLVDEISENADVSKGTLYNYFPDKESILVDYFQLIIADYGKRIKESLMVKNVIEVKLNKLLNLMNEIFANDLELTTVYFKYRMQKFFDTDPFDNSRRSGLENLVLAIIKDAQDNYELRSDIPALVIARAFLILTMDFFILNLARKGSNETENTNRQLLNLFLDGARP